MSKPIYEIYVMEKPWYKNDYGFPDCGIRERVGFYYERKTAIQAVEENWGDIQDYYADAAEIIEVRPGLYPLTKRLEYYLWNSEKKCFEIKDIPDFMENFNVQ